MSCHDVSAAVLANAQDLRGFVSPRDRSVAIALRRHASGLAMRQACGDGGEMMAKTRPNKRLSEPSAPSGTDKLELVTH